MYNVHGMKYTKNSTLNETPTIIALHFVACSSVSETILAKSSSSMFWLLLHANPSTPYACLLSFHLPNNAGTCHQLPLPYFHPYAHISTTAIVSANTHPTSTAQKEWSCDSSWAKDVCPFFYQYLYWSCNTCIRVSRVFLRCYSAREITIGYKIIYTLQKYHIVSRMCWSFALFLIQWRIPNAFFVTDTQPRRYMCECILPNVFFSVRILFDIGIV